VRQDCIRKIYIDHPAGQCAANCSSRRACLRQRNASGLHAFHTSDADFDAITRHFVPPDASEGFHIMRVTA